jgi:hypothetical protein
VVKALLKLSNSTSGSQLSRRARHASVKVKCKPKYQSAGRVSASTSRHCSVSRSLGVKSIVTRDLLPSRSSMVTAERIGSLRATTLLVGMGVLEESTSIAPTDGDVGGRGTMCGTIPVIPTVDALYSRNPWVSTVNVPLGSATRRSSTLDLIMRIGATDSAGRSATRVTRKVLSESFATERIVMISEAGRQTPRRTRST